MIIRTITGAAVAAALVAPIAASAHSVGVPHMHSGGSIMTNRLDPGLSMQERLAASCMIGVAPARLCARFGY